MRRGIPGDPEIRLHRQRPLERIIPPHRSSPAVGEGHLIATQPGVLYVVATPIGNLGDISARAREILAGVSVVAAEDTRHSGHLLRHLGLERPLVSLHEHNERARAAELVARLRAGECIALGQRRRHAAGQRSGLPAGRARRSMPASSVIADSRPCAAIAALSRVRPAERPFLLRGIPARARSRAPASAHGTRRRKRARS